MDETNSIVIELYQTHASAILKQILSWIFHIAPIVFVINLASCDNKKPQNQDQTTTVIEHNEASLLIDTIHINQVSKHINSLDSLLYADILESQSSKKQTNFSIKKTTDHNNSTYNYYGDFTYEKKAIKVKDTTSILTENDCIYDYLFINEHGTTLVISGTMFMPALKDDIEIRFNEYYNVDKILSTDLSKLKLTNKYLGISKILSISAINNSNNQTQLLNSQRCSSEYNIFIPLKDSIENLHSYQYLNQWNIDSAANGQYFLENDSLFYRITTNYISPIILAVEVAEYENDFKLKFKNKRWTSSIENILCYSEVNSLCYTGMKTGKGTFTFPSLLDPNKTVVYICFKLEGESVIYKEKLSNYTYSSRSNRYIISIKM